MVAGKGQCEAQARSLAAARRSSDFVALYSLAFAFDEVDPFVDRFQGGLLGAETRKKFTGVFIAIPESHAELRPGNGNAHAASSDFVRPTTILVANFSRGHPWCPSFLPALGAKGTHTMEHVRCKTDNCP